MKLIGSTAVKSVLMVVFMVTFLVACKNPLSSKIEERDLAPFQKSAVTLVGAGLKKTNAATFQQLSGHLTMKNDEPSALDLTLQTGSLASSDPKLNSKLKDKGFFEVQKFSTATFQSKKIEAVKGVDASVKSYNLSGDLNIKGKIIPITAPATLSVDNHDVIFSFKWTATREDWAKAFLEKPDDFFTEKLDVVAKLTFPKNIQPEKKVKE